MHLTSRQHESISVLALSVESLWIARVIQDAMDVALDEHINGQSSVDESRLHALRINRDVFERLGIYGCSAGRAYPSCAGWSATSRIELIRQVGVHWRAFIDASFGTSVSLTLIQALSDSEIRLLEQIQNFGRSLQLNSAAIHHDMNQQLVVLSLRQKSQRALRDASFLGPLQMGPLQTSDL